MILDFLHIGWSNFICDRSSRLATKKSGREDRPRRKKIKMQRSSIFNCHLFMRHTLAAILMLYSAFSFGQKKDKFSFAFQLQPELTYHKNNYAYRWKDTYTKSTFNIGIEATIQYYLTKRFFSETGLGYISRKLNTTVFLNQNVLPPPRGSGTQELVITKSVSFRTLQFPLNFGYNIISKQKMNLFLNAGLTENFLLNTYYACAVKYEGSYKKNYWQGYSVNLGLGTDYKILKKIKATSRISYSIINTMKDDEYLFSQDKYVIPLPHKFLRLSVGLRMTL